MSIWFKCDARFHKDPKILKLPNDTARFAFLMIIGEAKYVRSGGIFDDRQHLEACLPKEYHEAVDALLKAGLLVRKGKKIAIKAWSQWQVDPTSAERSRRARATAEQRSHNGNTTPPKRLSNGHATVESESDRESVSEREIENKIIYNQKRKHSNGQVESIGTLIRRATNAK